MNVYSLVFNNNLNGFLLNPEYKYNDLKFVICTYAPTKKLRRVDMAGNSVRIILPSPLPEQGRTYESSL